MDQAISSHATRDGKATILCVDDDPDTLKALDRLLSEAGYQMVRATDAVTGLEQLQHLSIDIVISGWRTPEACGTAFLQQVRKRWPQTICMVMAGQSDRSTEEAFGSVEIQRFITKPWNERELLQNVRDAIERKLLLQDKARLEALALARAHELKALNASLERNASASQEELALANDRLKSNFVVSLKMFSSLIEIRRSRLAGHSRRVAHLARKVASMLGLEASLVQEVFVAGLLHEIGKLGFSDELLDTPVAEMKPWQLTEYRRHASDAEQLLMPLQDLRGAAASIAAQLERFDGGGHPNHLRGRAILVGARILAVCADYDNLQIGVLVPRKLSQRQALAVINGANGTRYDPWVVEALVNVVTEQAPASGQTTAVTEASSAVDELGPDEAMVGAGALVKGMALARDLVAPSGLMMLTAEHMLDDRLIQKVLDFERSSGTTLAIYIKKDDAPDARSPAAPESSGTKGAGSTSAAPTDTSALPGAAAT